MNRFLAFKITGPYHQKKGIVCQDSFFVKEKDNVIFASVADGVGSEKHSDIGSRIASRVAVEFCFENYSSQMSFSEIQNLMKKAYKKAWKAVEKKAIKDGNVAIEEYNTTMTLAIYNGKEVFFGQSGDSGILAYAETGEIKVVTQQQRDDNGCVYPLCCGEQKWVFGQLNYPVHALMLTTDGVFEQMVPPILNQDKSLAEQRINVANAIKFLDRNECKNEDVEITKRYLYQYLKNYPEYALDDDKTIVILWNDKSKVRRLDEKYYLPIDWSKVYKKLRDIIK